MQDAHAKVALVTGAGKRVGASIARRLFADGYSVAVHYHQARAEAESFCDELRAQVCAAERSSARGVRAPDVAAFEADLRSTEAIRGLVAAVVSRWGRLDVLVPSAANFLRERWPSDEDETWRRSIALNLDAPRRLAAASTPHLLAHQGTIVFVTCASTHTPYRHYASYQVSKAGVRQLMRVLALELAPRVRVNAVAPGTVLPPEQASPALVEGWAAEVPLRRIGTAEDVAAAVSYLAGAPFVTGHELRVDGGYAVRTYAASTTASSPTPVGDSVGG